MKIIKVRFLREGNPHGKPYTYYSPVNVAIGDTVQINSASTGVVTEVDVLEEEIAPYRDAVKTIIGLAETKTEEIFDPEKAHNAQVAYCREKMYPHFAPSDGKCWRCRQNIYLPGKNRNWYQSLGINVERAGREIITGCPHCNWSFCE